MSVSLGRKTEADWTFTLEVTPGEREAATTASATEWTISFDRLKL